VILLKNSNEQFYASIIICLLVLPIIAAMVVSGNTSSTIGDSETTTRTKAGEVPKILWVLDDSSYSYITPMNTTYALLDGLPGAFPSTKFDAIVVGASQDGPSLKSLELYDIVIWATGTDDLNTLRAKDRTALTNYLYRGGRLWLIGSGIADDIVGQDTAFIVEFTRMSKYLSAGKPSTLDGVSGDPITDGMSVQTQSIYYTSGTVNIEVGQYADHYNVADGAVGIFGSTGNYTASRYYNETYGYKTVFFAFDFGMIYSNESRIDICKKVIDWLGFREKHANDVGITDLYIPLISNAWSSEVAPSGISTFGKIYGIAGKEMKINVTARNFDNKTHSNVEIVCEIYEYDPGLTGAVLRQRFSTIKAISNESETTVTFAWTPPLANYYRIITYTVLRSDTNSENNILDFGIFHVAKWYDGAEGGTNGWTTINDTWNIIGAVPNDPRTYNHSAGHVWYCGDSTYNYSANLDTYLVSPVIDLTNMDTDYWFTFAFLATGASNWVGSAGDYMIPVIRNATGAPGDWMLLRPYIYNATSGVLDPRTTVFGGNLTAKWYRLTNQLQTANTTGCILNGFGYDKVQIGFWFKSDADVDTVNSTGFYLDDFLVSGFEKYTESPTDIWICSISDVPEAYLNQVTPVSAIVKNNGTTAESFSVKITMYDEEGNIKALGDPDATNGVKEVTSLAPGETTTVTWNWKPTAEGKYYPRVEIQGASNDNDLSNNTYDRGNSPYYFFAYNVTNDVRNFTLSPSLPSGESRLYFASGDAKDVDVFLNATEGFSGNVSITTNVGSGWIVTVPGSNTLDVNQSKIVKVRITAPTSLQGQNTTVTVTATSTNPSRTIVFNVTLTLNETKIITSYGLELPSTIALKSTKPGWVVNYTVPVKNTGNTNDSFSLSITHPSGWSAEFKNNTDSVITSTGTIASGQSANVTLKITVPSSVSTGNYNTTITATSVGNTSKSAALSITTNVTATTQPGQQNQTNQTVNPVQGVDFAILSGDVRYSPRVDITDGNEVLILATVSNKGTSKAPASTVGFYLDGREASNKIGEVSLPEIVSKGTQQASIYWTAVAGVHTIYIKADSFNNVSEADEDNNTASIEIMVAQNPGTGGEGSAGFIPGYEMFIVVVAISAGMLRKKHKMRL